jgi:hypothetical protein
MNATELTNELKAAKIGKGCKFSTLSNCVTISYPKHKTQCLTEPNPFLYEGSQKEKDDKYVLENYSINSGKGTLVHKNRMSIQIYVN